MMRLEYSRVNQAWLFMFGSSPVRLNPSQDWRAVGPLFYPNRLEAVGNAAACGLVVTVTNDVFAPSPTAQTPHGWSHAPG